MNKLNGQQIGCDCHSKLIFSLIIAFIFKQVGITAKQNVLKIQHNNFHINLSYSKFQDSRTIRVINALMKNSRPKSITSARSLFESLGIS